MTEKGTINILIGYNYSINQQDEIQEVQKGSPAFRFFKNKQDINGEFN